ncbi:gibberellin-regulated protein 11 [Prunus persica]|nr:gibberellin-regulated protein 11 [Prunus persica]
MALSSRLTLMMASLVFSFLVLQYLTEAAHQSHMMNNNGAPSPLPPPTLDCGVACEGRCKLSSRPRLCKRACGSCCDKCSCVPPGTAGNYEACPCYASLTTRNQTRKCP